MMDDVDAVDAGKIGEASTTSTKSTSSTSANNCLTGRASDRSMEESLMEERETVS